MASIRRLKHEISALANELVLATIFKKSDIVASDIEQINLIIFDINEFEDNFRSRSRIADKSLPSKDVKKYYKDILLDMEKSISCIIEKINSIN